MTMPKQRNPEWPTHPIAAPVPDGRTPQFSLDVVAGPDQGLRVISSGGVLNIGTNPKNELILTDSTVSRRHCQIVVDNAGFLLHDLGSTNGTSLGGHRVV